MANDSQLKDGTSDDHFRLILHVQDSSHLVGKTNESSQTLIAAAFKKSTLACSGIEVTYIAAVG